MIRILPKTVLYVDYSQTFLFWGYLDVNKKFSSSQTNNNILKCDLVF
jgi:hypothetical protein